MAREQTPSDRLRPRGPETVELLLGLLDRMRQHFAEVAGAHDLTPQQAAMLHQLPDDGRPMRELADTLHCDASNVTGIADRLEAAGLVERRVGAVDRRVKTLRPTAAGRALRGDLDARLSALPPPLLALDDGERAQLTALLRRMLEA